jgi:hypothetical protein
MHDDQQLRTILRQLDRPTDPDPGFADALFSQLTVASRTRPSRTLFMLLAAAMLVALLAAGTVVGSGLIDLPWFSADATPPVMPTASASESPEASATPEPTGSPASQEPTPSATPQVGGLQVGSMVAPVVDGVTLRESPGTAGIRIGTLARGSMNYVVDGPVDTDGYTWYQLSGPGLPPASSCEEPVPTDPLECPTWFGWAAVGEPVDTIPWFEPTHVDCPDPAAQTDAFFRLPQIVLAACYGDDELSFEAFYAELPEGGVGTFCAYPPAGTPSEPAEPVDEAVEWLYCLNYNQVWSSSEGNLFQTVYPEQTDVGLLTLYVDPASGITLPERGRWLRVTGAFDHPAATLCAAAEEGYRADPNPDQAVLGCRTHFVVSAVEVISAP